MQMKPPFTPTPLPAHSAHLRRFRVEAWIGRKLGQGRYAQEDLGRFATLDDAIAWVADVHPFAEVVRYTYFSETDGWKGHAINLEERNQQ